MKKNILITGAAGFLGSHLCDFFISKNFNVIGIDNLSTGNLENISHLKDLSNFSFEIIDITKSFEIKNSLDYILHFASPASPIDYLNLPIETLRAGSIGVENVLKIALQKKAKILIASTSEVYGDPLQHPQREDYYGNVNPIGPRSVYDEAKRFQEAITTAYHTHFGLNISIARIFNTYGPRMRKNDGRVIPAFLNQIIENKPITIFGNGKQTRSFCYVDDLILGIFKLLKSNISSPVNLGNPSEISIVDFANELIDTFGNNSSISFKKFPQNDPLKRKPDISKAINLLNWKPKVLRKEGIKLTYEYFKSK